MGNIMQFQVLSLNLTSRNNLANCSCITNTSKIATLRSAGPPYAVLQSALYVGVI